MYRVTVIRTRLATACGQRSSLLLRGSACLLLGGSLAPLVGPLVGLLVGLLLRGWLVSFAAAAWFAAGFTTYTVAPRSTLRLLLDLLCNCLIRSSEKGGKTFKTKRKSIQFRFMGPQPISKRWGPDLRSRGTLGWWPSNSGSIQPYENRGSEINTTPIAPLTFRPFAAISLVSHRALLPVHSPYPPSKTRS
jgi:hypothetical protein